MTDYTLVRSNRKSISIQIKEGLIIVRAPLFTSEKTIEKFVNEHEAWIIKTLEKEKRAQKAADESGHLSDKEIKALTKKAKEYIPLRAAYYARLLNVSYGKITIRHQKTIWGSCTRQGNLSFNAALMLAPSDVIDSIVVHELCHRKQMNHSKRFYSEIYKVFPEYEKCNKWLKENGKTILRRCYT